MKAITKRRNPQQVKLTRKTVTFTTFQDSCALCLCSVLPNHLEHLVPSTDDLLSVCYTSPRQISV